jgi:hypothetical protein
MLDDDEYRQVMSFRDVFGGGGNLQEKFAPMLAEYERITGCRETNPNAVFHHRLSDYGPPLSLLWQAIANSSGETLR